MQEEMEAMRMFIAAFVELFSSNAVECDVAIFKMQFGF